MLTIDEIVQGCLAGCRRPDGAQAVVDVVRRAVSCPDELESALGPAAEAGETTVFASPELTVSRLVWAPRMSMYAHDHVNRESLTVRSGVPGRRWRWAAPRPDLRPAPSPVTEAAARRTSPDRAQQAVDQTM